MVKPDHDPLDELVRLQVLQLRRQMDSQADTIIELNKAGFSNARIAELLGTTAPTVSVALHRSKNRGTKPAKGTKGPGA